MSNLQYVRHKYTCAVNFFLNVDTCTAYGISMHSTAFHGYQTVDYNLYRCWYGKTKWQVSQGPLFLRLAFLRKMIFCNCTVKLKWFFCPLINKDSTFDAFWVVTCLDVDLARCPVENTSPGKKKKVNLRANYTLYSKTYLLIK